jgi:hypothetical protein
VTGHGCSSGPRASEYRQERLWFVGLEGLVRLELVEEQ